MFNNEPVASVLDRLRKRIRREKYRFNETYAMSVNAMIKERAFGEAAVCEMIVTMIDKELEELGDCTACSIEAEIGTEKNPHPVPSRFHICRKD